MRRCVYGVLLAVLLATGILSWRAFGQNAPVPKSNKLLISVPTSVNEGEVLVVKIHDPDGELANGKVWLAGHGVPIFSGSPDEVSPDSGNSPVLPTLWPLTSTSTGPPRAPQMARRSVAVPVRLSGTLKRIRQVVLFQPPLPSDRGGWA